MASWPHGRVVVRGVQRAASGQPLSAVGTPLVCRPAVSCGQVRSFGLTTAASAQHPTLQLSPLQREWQAVDCTKPLNRRFIFICVHHEVFRNHGLI